MDVLGISCHFHDSAAALVRDGQIIAAAEEERFSRIKHDYGFPHQAIDFCLRMGGIPASQLDCVAFFEKPLLKFERLILSCLQTFPNSHRVFRESMISWFGDKLWVKQTIQKYLDIAPSKIVFSEHHLSHAASAFLCSPFEEAAILTVDGVGEWTTTSYGIGRGSDIRLLNEIRFPHSLGLLYSAFTAFLGFQVNEGEYKVMGMAPYGKPRYKESVYKLVQMDDHGGFELNMDYFSFHYSTDQTFNSKFVDLFGAPRNPEAAFQLPRDQFYADIAASIQSALEDILIQMACHIQRVTGQKKLCMAGGVALNSVANGKLLRATPFEEIYIQPAAGDGGGSLGAALWASHTLLGVPRRQVMEHAYWGESHESSFIAKYLDSEGISYDCLEDTDRLVDQTADLIQSGQVVGWYQGRSEFGPRALGNRSILADPRKAEMQEIVNTKIKFREPFRPFAPSVLAENAEQYFDLPDAGRHYPARFMLYVVNVKETMRDKIPATTHVDGTGRIQTVHQKTNPKYYELIQRFGESTGIPVLLNTSFNLRGEPIVNTPQQAFETFRRSHMDALVLGDYLIQRSAIKNGV